MFKYILITLLSCSVAIADEPNKILHEKCIYPTVKIETGFNECGSGVIIKSFKEKDGSYTNVVLTSSHVVKRDMTIFVGKYENWSTLTGFDKFEPAIFQVNHIYDLAILFFTSKKEMPVAELDFNEKYYIGSKIFKVGFGALDDSRLDGGEITSVKFLKEDIVTNHIRINATTIFGDSGGPCYLASTNKVIGINKAIRVFNGVPLSQHAFVTPIGFLKIWNKEVSGALDCVLDKNKPIDIPVDILIKANKLRLLFTEKKLIEESLLNINKKIAEVEKGLEIEVAPPPPGP